MPEPFHHLTLDRFAGLLRAFRFTRRVEAVHLHHTWRPDHAQYNGHASIVAMWRYHTEVNGWSDIAQHVSVAPDGVIWTGRSWNAAPASSKGYNGTAEVGPFMIEMIGDFDVGRDPFVDPQRAAVLGVIAQVQRHFELAPDALRFHNAMTKAKTCPGTQLDRPRLIADLAELHLDLAAEDPGVMARSPLPFDDDQTQAYRIATTLARSAPSSVDERDAEPAEEHGSAAERAVVAGVRPVVAGDRQEGKRAASALSMADLESLRPHVVNLRGGRFSDDGAFRTRSEDVEAIFQHHLPDYVARTRAAGLTPRLVLFAHGGLISEKGGLAIAHKQADWWRRAGVYPLFFVWETGLADTIADLVAGRLSRRAPAVTTARATRGLFPERLWNRLVEHAARGARASRVWEAMKASAATASADGGGAREVMERLRLLAQTDADIELHAIGHSAGSIFHSHLLPMAVDRGLRFETLQLLAPAVTVDEFRERLLPLLEPGGGVEACTIFTMLDDYEERDVYELPLLQDYGRSLLYLIHHGLEERARTPILGLERCLRGDPELVRLLSLNGGSGSHGVVWSMSNSTTGRSASLSTAHGAFDDDRATMESVMRRVLRLADTADVTPFPDTAARDIQFHLADDEADEVDLLLDALQLGSDAVGDGVGDVDVAAPPRLPQVAFAATSAHAGSNGASGDGLAPVSAVGIDEEGEQGGRRMALCVGIDAYAGRDRLQGCVRDASQWQEALQGIGFTVATLVDGAATRQAIEAELGALIDLASPGDTVVFQYAGHGTEAPDVNGDETGGNNGRKDEALCPVDYADGHLLIDDDIGAIFDRARPGVSITCFMDCCHSGTISRVALGEAPEPAGESARARYLVLAPEVIALHREFRQRAGAGEGGTRSRKLDVPRQGGMPEVVFSACRDIEVAWEAGGQGAFTVRAAPLLARAVAERRSNRVFFEWVKAAFGGEPSQHPILDCARGAQSRPLLRPVVAGRGGAGVATPADVSIGSSKPPAAWSQ